MPKLGITQRVWFQCPACQEIFWRTPSAARKRSDCCSRACWKKHHYDQRQAHRIVQRISPAVLTP